jgi:hypothetical protein
MQQRPVISVVNQGMWRPKMSISNTSITTGLLAWLGAAALTLVLFTSVTTAGILG